MSPDRRFVSMDIIPIIRMVVRLTVITAQSGSLAASLSVLDRGITVGDVRIGITDSIVPVSTVADTMAEDSKDAVLNGVDSRVADTRVAVSRAAADRKVTDSVAAKHAVEARSTEAKAMVEAASTVEVDHTEVDLPTVADDAN